MSATVEHTAQVHAADLRYGDVMETAGVRSTVIGSPRSDGWNAWGQDMCTVLLKGGEKVRLGCSDLVTLVKPGPYVPKVGEVIGWGVAPVHKDGAVWVNHIDPVWQDRYDAEDQLRSDRNRLRRNGSDSWVAFVLVKVEVAAE